MEFPHDTPFHLRCGEAYITQSPNLIGDPPSNYTHILFTGTVNQALQFRLQKTLRNNRDEKTILVEHRSGHAVSIHDRYAYLSSDLSMAMPVAVQETTQNGVRGYKLTHESFGQFIMTYAIDQDGRTMLGRYIRIRTPSPPYLGTLWKLEEPRMERFVEYHPVKNEDDDKSPVSEFWNVTSRCWKLFSVLVIVFVILGLALKFGMMKNRMK